MAVFLFPAPTVREACCPLCHRALALHQVHGRGVRCVQDVVVGRDQLTAARRARLAQLQLRALKVHPWAVDAEGVGT